MNDPRRQVKKGPLDSFALLRRGEQSAFGIQLKSFAPLPSVMAAQPGADRAALVEKHQQRGMNHRIWPMDNAVLQLKQLVVLQNGAAGAYVGWAHVIDERVQEAQRAERAAPKKGPGPKKKLAAADRWAAGRLWRL